MELMKELPDACIDLMVTDPPYAITKNKWDKSIDLSALWLEWNRIVKQNGAFVFMSAQPFTTDLINSNRGQFRYDLIWEKSIATGFLNANKMPLRAHEVVLVFYRKLPTYNPMKHFLPTPSFKKGNPARGSSNYGKFTHEMDIGSKDGSRFPRSIFNVPYENSFFDSTSGTVQKMLHPTQKPIDLFRYLITTYSNQGDTIFDGFIGSGTTAVAALMEKRKVIGSEIDKDYYNAMMKRVKEQTSQLTLI